MKVLYKVCCISLSAFLMILVGISLFTDQAFANAIVEFPISYPNKTSAGSTHEIAFHDDILWVTGQNHDQLVAIKPDGTKKFYNMPTGSGPHGIAFDQDGYLWVTLEFAGEVIRLDPQRPDYNSATRYDVKLYCPTCSNAIPNPINTNPHGLTIGNDGQTVWYTGKATGTLGRITPDGKLETIALSQFPNSQAIVGSVPIYIHPDAVGNIWFTELVGNAIGRITPTGTVQEFKIPTPNSRPIAILQGPDGNMWFTEEASNKVGRIERDCITDCKITEFQLPKPQDNFLLAALTFDNQNNLWVQQYVDIKHPYPSGIDRLIKIDKQILATNSADRELSLYFYDVPTSETVMHRIILGPDNNLWFTELNTDQVSKLDPSTVAY